MAKTRIQKAKLNIATTLMSQIVSMLCGIVVPGVMISSFGSEVYGATASVAQFLSYITLLEGGIGGIARAELYDPLAKQDNSGISNVYYASKRFLSGVGAVFIVYTLVIAFFYRDIADATSFDRLFTFQLVCVISIATIAQYFGGIAHQILLNADQKRYVSNVVVMVTTVLNTLITVALAYAGFGVITVKLVSSFIFVLRPIIFSAYVRKNYTLVRPTGKISALKQKWTGLGQHLAYFFHRNTDIVLLTLLADLKTVSVYSVYYLIVGSMRNLVSSFSGGMEALFGEMFAKKEYSSLRAAFRKYQFILSAVSIVLFGTTVTMIVPFVRLYTSEISDADYIQPIFAVVLVFAEVMNCVTQSCSDLVISANRLRESQRGAYGEAAINVGLSIILIRLNPLVGVAVGTLAASVFKGVYYMFYSCKHILEIRIGEIAKSFVFTGVAVGVCALVGLTVIPEIEITNFVLWAVWALVMFVIVSAGTLAAGKILYPDELHSVISSLKTKYKR